MKAKNERKKSRDNISVKTMVMMEAAARFSNSSTSDIHREGSMLSSSIAAVESEIEELSARLSKARAEKAESEARLDGLAMVLSRR